MTTKQATYATFLLGFVAMAGGYLMAARIVGSPVLLAVLVTGLALSLYLSHYAKGRATAMLTAIVCALACGVSAKVVFAYMASAFA